MHLPELLRTLYGGATGESFAALLKVMEGLGEPL